MSTANNITVRVTLGEPYLARAGTGIFATNASSTSSAYFAALHAAAKFFELPNEEIEMSQTERGDRNLRTPDFFLAWPKRISAAGTLTLTRSDQPKINNPKSKIHRRAA